MKASVPKRQSGRICREHAKNDSTPTLRTHDYIRHGTTTLFAALDYATGKILHAHHRRHTHEKWLSFLRQVDRSVLGEVSLEIIADNYVTHKHASVER